MGDHRFAILRRRHRDVSRRQAGAQALSRNLVDHGGNVFGESGTRLEKVGVTPEHRFIDGTDDESLGIVSRAVSIMCVGDQNEREVVKIRVFHRAKESLNVRSLMGAASFLLSNPSKSSSKAPAPAVSGWARRSTSPSVSGRGVSVT